MQAMPTDKPRINMTLPDELYRLLKKIADAENIPLGTKAVELLSRLLKADEAEDIALSHIADTRLGDERAFIPDTDDAWK